MGTSTERTRRWRAANPEKLAAHRAKEKETRKFTPEQIEAKRVYVREWKQKNKERIAKNNAEYKRNNADVIRVQRRGYQRTLLATNVQAKIKLALRKRINSVFVKGITKPRSAVIALGCSIEHFKTHIESKFSEGMSWDNYGKWHLDHIVPLSAYDLTDPVQYDSACHWSNIQPLWASDNIAKGGTNRTQKRRWIDTENAQGERRAGCGSNAYSGAFR